MEPIQTSRPPLARQMFSSRDKSNVLGIPSFARDLDLNHASAYFRAKNKQRTGREALSAC